MSDDPKIQPVPPSRYTETVHHRVSQSCKRTTTLDTQNTRCTVRHRKSSPFLPSFLHASFLRSRDPFSHPANFSPIAHDVCVCNLPPSQMNPPPLPTRAVMKLQPPFHSISGASTRSDLILCVPRYACTVF